MNPIADVVTGLAGPLFGLVDKLFTSDDERAAAKLKLKDFHGALRDARTAKVIDCDYVKAWFREGSALTELGDYENAALCFFEGMQVEGQSENPDLKRGFDDAIKKGRDALGKK